MKKAPNFHLRFACGASRSSTNGRFNIHLHFYKLFQTIIFGISNTHKRAQEHRENGEMFATGMTDENGVLVIGIEDSAKANNLGLQANLEKSARTFANKS